MGGGEWLGWTILALGVHPRGREAVWPGLPIRLITLDYGWRRKGPDWHLVRDNWSWLGSCRQSRQGDFLVPKCLAPLLVPSRSWKMEV